MRHDHYRQASISRFKAALDSSGKPTAWINQYVEKHDPIEAPYIPYGIDNQYIHYAESGTHVPWGFWRSVDHSLHAFFTESFIDEVALQARIPTSIVMTCLPTRPAIRKFSTWPQRKPTGILHYRKIGAAVSQFTSRSALLLRKLLKLRLLTARFFHVAPFAQSMQVLRCIPMA